MARLQDITKVRAFIEVCVYYRAWINDFPLISESIFHLFQSATRNKEKSGRKERTRKLVEFRWGVDQARAMRHLKEALVKAPALMPLIYKPDLSGFVG
jgi:hypothetical protein